MDDLRTDETLMRAYAAGDAAAFRVLYGRHRDRLFRLLGERCFRRDDVDAQFQSTWRAVIEARGRFPASVRFSDWLERIAEQQLALLRRRRGEADEPAAAETAGVNAGSRSGESPPPFPDGPAAEVKPILDHMILRAARAAVAGTTSPVQRPWWRGWRGAVWFAALVIIGVSTVRPLIAPDPDRAAATASSPPPDPVESTPHLWLQRIRDLRATGQSAAVAGHLARFRDRYPAHPLPEDLR